MKFLLVYNMKMSLIGVGGGGGWNKPLPLGDTNFVGWGEATRGIFPGEETSKVLASRRGDSLPIHSAGKTLIVLDTLARSHKRTNA